jgi:prepilin signal peptidase PulO-like enzyme (type II secretory pathway)
VPDAVLRVLLHLRGHPPGGAAVSSLRNASGLLPSVSLFGLLGWLFEKLRHKEGLGFGDVKMIAMIGAFLGIGARFLP